jgi:gluconate 2-dehydrogenase gamma chain
MTKYDEARRAFLVGAGAVAGSGLVPEALAEQRIPDEATSTRSISNGDEHHAFFNDEDAATIAAFAERLMPGAKGISGATDAGVLNYIDLALAGAYSDQQDFYRRGLAALETYCQQTHKLSFARLPASRQDEVIKAVEEGKASGFSWPTSSAFFHTVRTHTMEGMFADPLYGGNKDFVGWQLVGFPGTQLFYTEEEMQSRDKFTSRPIVGLKTQMRG